MTYPKSNKKRVQSRSSMKKASHSQYWSDFDKKNKIMGERIEVFVRESNIQIAHPKVSSKEQKSVSTIVTSKGKIIID